MLAPTHHPPALAGGGTLPGKVLHLVGGLSAEVLSFLGPTSAALQQAGVEQVLICADAHADVAALFGLAESVARVPVPAAGGRWRQWRAARAALRRELHRDPDAAIHVHGFVAALMALRARQRAGARGVVYYSPHGSASLGRLRPLGRLLQWLARPLTGCLPFDRVIASCAVEAQLLPGPAPVHLAESPVARCFFTMRRQPAVDALVLAGVLEEGELAADRVASLAVLLGDEVMRASVRWVGPVTAGAAPLLRAAGIQATTGGGESALAALMAEAWVFVAPVAATRFPLLLAQAMSAGLPCVALDSPFNRALIRHGETGYLCSDLEQLLRRARDLIESAPLRQRIGKAARHEAARRFDEVSFRRAVLDGYALPAAPLPLALAGPEAAITRRAA